MKPKPNPEFDDFTRTVDKLLSVPREELQKREKEYRERVARNPRKRGPKKRIKPPASRDVGDGV
jgi:hypothetical protein